jgi:DNA polymerase III sliding clamp (beta) subunit (PCNA family)
MKKIISVLILSLILTRLSYSQDIIKLVTGETIMEKVKEIRENEIVYKIDGSAPLMTIDKSKVAFIELEADKMYFYNYDIKKHDINTPELQQLAMNNSSEIVKQEMNVFVPISSKSVQERAARLKSKQILVRDGYWNVVETPHEAHFIFEFFIDDKGVDRAYFVMKSRDGDILYTSKKIIISHGDNQIEEGLKTAETFFKDDYDIRSEYTTLVKLIERKTKKSNKKNHE